MKKLILISIYLILFVIGCSSFDDCYRTCVGINDCSFNLENDVVCNLKSSNSEPVLVERICFDECKGGKIE